MSHFASASNASEARLNATDLDRVYAQQSIAASVIKSWIAIIEASQQVNLYQNLVKFAKNQNQLFLKNTVLLNITPPFLAFFY